MKNMNLSVLFWILGIISVAISVTTFASSDSTFLSQLLFLAHTLAALVIGALYWMTARQQTRMLSQTSRDENEDIRQKLTRSHDEFNSLLSSLQATRSVTERSADAVSNLHGLMQTTTENAKQAALLSHQSRTTVEASVTAISDLFNSMNEVSTSSRKVEEILRLIEDIAFQTNLLALNAAVEAARAGEQGKGFAVVAEAVRALAQRSSAAAKDISVLIKETNSNIQKGSHHAQSSRELLNSILAGILKVSDINNEISLSTQEQVNGAHNLHGLLKELEKTQMGLADDRTIIPAERAPTEKSFTIAETTMPLAKKNKPAIKKDIPAVNIKPDAKPAALPIAKSVSKAATKPPVARPTLVKKDKPISPAPAPVASADAKPETATTARMPVKEKSKVVLDLKATPKTSKTPQEMIPFDEDEDRLKLTKASDF